MTEVWKKSLSFPCLEVSSLARVRRCEDQINQRWRVGLGCRNKGYLYSVSLKNGYYFIRLSVDGKRKHLLINRLVCEAFNGAAPSSDHHAAHKNGDKSDNSPNNLYWATPQQNIADREQHGTTMRGDAHYCRKLSSKDIPHIRKMLSLGKQIKSIAKSYGVGASAIGAIKRGLTWKSV